MWTPRIPCAFPISLIVEANQLAAIIDPDAGGDKTFTSEVIRSDGDKDYVYAEIPFKEHFLPLVQSRDVNLWKLAIAQLAEDKGMDMLSDETIETLCAGLLLGEECAVFATRL